ncbi:MAG: succinylglutamate desuccinylase/aspartoacylase family protein [Candidatus Paceibacterota bacterium]
MKEKFYEFLGKEKGVTSVIVAGIHGNERAGIEALESMMPLNIEKGRVLVGCGNILAIERNVRCVGANLNRMFKSDKLLSDKEKESYEYGRAQFLKKYFNQADALLDVHCSFVEKSRPFIVCEENAFEAIKYLPFDLAVTGLDSIQAGGTDYYMNRRGKIGIGVECGYLGDDDAIKVASDYIVSFLASRGHIKAEMKIIPKTVLNAFYLHKAKTNDFKLAKAFEDFEKVIAGQLIGFDGGEEVKAARDGAILFARNMDKPGEEVFVLGEYKKGLASD